MKKLTFTLLLFLAMSTSLISQTKEITTSGTATTYQEYQFLTNTLANADDAKLPEGYKFETFKEMDLDGFNFLYRLYIEEKTEKVKAVSVEITKIKRKEDKKRYLCIPFNNNALFSEFVKDSQSLGVSMSLKHDAISKALLCVFFDYIYNVKE